MEELGAGQDFLSKPRFAPGCLVFVDDSLAGHLVDDLSRFLGQGGGVCRLLGDGSIGLLDGTLHFSFQSLVSLGFLFGKHFPFFSGFRSRQRNSPCCLVNGRSIAQSVPRPK